MGLPVTEPCPFCRVDVTTDVQLRRSHMSVCVSIEHGPRFDWFEWQYPDRGVPWRMGGGSLKRFEALLDDGWEVFHSWNNGCVLRKARPRLDSDRLDV